MLKRIVRYTLRHLPLKWSLIKAGAALPPTLKSRFTTRFFSYLRTVAETEGAADVLSTNLGLSTQLTVKLPPDTNGVYLFGCPDQYTGERGPLWLAEELLPHCDGFVDIGAHYGYFIYFLRSLANNVHVPIYFFEPHPELFGNIEYNVARNHLRDVHGSRAAIGSRTGTMNFYLNLSDVSSSSLTQHFAHKHAMQEVVVETITFDDFVRSIAADGLCVKVDVENAEFEFLSGAATEGHRIKYLIIEVLGPAVHDNFVVSAQRQLGMQAYYINDFRLEHSLNGEFTYVAPEYNWLFCHEQPDELRKLLAGGRFTVVDVAG